MCCQHEAVRFALQPGTDGVKAEPELNRRVCITVDGRGDLTKFILLTFTVTERQHGRVRDIWLAIPLDCLPASSMREARCELPPAVHVAHQWLLLQIQMRVHPAAQFARIFEAFCQAMGFELPMCTFVFKCPIRKVHLYLGGDDTPQATGLCAVFAKEQECHIEVRVRDPDGGSHCFAPGPEPNMR